MILFCFVGFEQNGNNYGKMQENDGKMTEILEMKNLAKLTQPKPKSPLVYPKEKKGK